MSEGTHEHTDGPVVSQGHSGQLLGGRVSWSLIPCGQIQARTKVLVIPLFPDNISYLNCLRGAAWATPCPPVLSPTPRWTSCREEDFQGASTPVIPSFPPPP